MMKLKIKNNRKKQYETLYVIYMICGSYFKECKCRNREIESRLRLFYMELKENDQFRLESEVERRFLAVCDEHLDEIGEMKAEFRLQASEKEIYAYLETGIYDYIFKVEMDGSYEVGFRNM